MIVKYPQSILTINLIMEDSNVKPIIKNIQEYVANAVITELNKQNKKIEELKYIVNQVHYCETCRLVDLNMFSNYASCQNCGKISCGKGDCFQTWIDDRSSLGEIIYFCCSDCHIGV